MSGQFRAGARDAGDGVEIEWFRQDFRTRPTRQPKFVDAVLAGQEHEAGVRTVPPNIGHDVRGTPGG